ncbi:hypothetical protein KY290_006975 [Solanum tuberosum]|uniref:Uncharacterized protein n=1 Tax=Solanum tuberosum TaxID=4113 RepID=A0ABQ7W483_SOLTU|nr:hypothetical protein KY285_006877 [Solanum tuberosum]KAH0775564.1 hypothetical protein KY290_006975 [Solanum tuberosum]
MLDLSHNNISGPIPHCLGNIMQNPWDTDVYDSSSFGYGDFEMFGGNTLIDVDDSFETTSTISFPNSFGAYDSTTYSAVCTFDESSYEGNPVLCGPPLHISCTEAKEIPTYLLAPDFSEDDASFLAMEWFCISFLVAYANVVVAVVVVLCVNPSWRNVWFYYIESFMYSCYDYFASKSSRL